MVENSKYDNLRGYCVHVYVCTCVYVKYCAQNHVYLLVAQLCLFVTPWTVAHQAPLSMEFSRQEYWSFLPFHSPGDLPNPGIKPRPPALQAGSLPSSHQGSPKSWSLLFLLLSEVYTFSIQILSSTSVVYINILEI